MEIALLRTEEPPRYQRLAQQALHLYELGLSMSAIGRRLGADDKAIAKAIEWLEAVRS